MNNKTSYQITYLFKRSWVRCRSLLTSLDGTLTYQNYIPGDLGGERRFCYNNFGDLCVVWL